MDFAQAYQALEDVKGFIQTLEPTEVPPVQKVVTIDDITKLNDAIIEAGPGGKVVVTPGFRDFRQTIGISAGGTAEKPVTISGFGATFEGNRNKGEGSIPWELPETIAGARNVKQQPIWGNTGNNFLNLNAGANHIVIEGFELRNFGRAISYIDSLEDVTVQDIKFRNCQDYCWQRYNETSGIKHKHLVYRNLHGEGFSKSAIRIDGLGTEDVLIEGCYFDSGFQSNDEFAMGIFLRAGKKIRINNTTCKNCVDIETSGYWNGDGITIEREVSDVIITNYVARGCSDGGIDTKGDDVHLINPDIEGCKNNIRVWNYLEIVDGHVGNPVKAIGAPWGTAGGSGDTNNVMAIGGASATSLGAHIILKGSFTMIGEQVAPHAHGSAGNTVYNLNIEDLR